MRKLTLLILTLLFVLSSGCAFFKHDRGHGKYKKVWKNGHYYNQSDHDDNRDGDKHK